MATAEIPAFDLSMKKKKKKKVVKEKEVEQVTEELENLEVTEKEKDDEEEPAREEEQERDAGDEPSEAPEAIDFGGKKKKAKKKVSVADTPTQPAQAISDVSFADQDGKEVLPWAGSDRDYTYEELAGRIYSLLHSHNPDLGSKQKRYVMKPPQLVRDGTKKSVWVNFAEICTILKRKPDHVLNYVLAELGTNGSVDGTQRLVIKGRFQPKQIEIVIRHYITEYVACRTCKSPDTNLKKENRLYFLCCESCGSTRSVAAIKKGFEAQVGKRKKDKQ